MASKATSDLLLVAAIVGGGYLILKTTKLGEALGGVGEGVAEAAGGLGAGIGIAGQGLGVGVAELSGQVTAITGDIAELTSFVGEWGLGLAQEIRIIKERQIREAGQETQIDVAAFERAQAQLAEIQAEKEIKTAAEQAERSRLIQEEKTQVVEFITTAPEKFVTGLGAMWRYSPVGLLTSWITNIVSVEKEAAPQQSAPDVVGAGGSPAPTTIPTTIRRPTKSTREIFEEEKSVSTGGWIATPYGYSVPAPKLISGYTYV